MMLLKELKAEAENALIIKYEKMLDILTKHEQKWTKILNERNWFLNIVSRFKDIYDIKMFVLDYKISYYKEKLAKLKNKENRNG